MRRRRKRESGMKMGGKALGGGVEEGEKPNYHYYGNTLILLYFCRVTNYDESNLPKTLVNSLSHPFFRESKKGGSLSSSRVGIDF